jgi:hypothetical protein
VLGCLLKHFNQGADVVLAQSQLKCFIHSDGEALNENTIELKFITFLRGFCFKFRQEVASDFEGTLTYQGNSVCLGTIN